MTVDTSNCSFDSTPMYFTSMGGNSNHYALGGYTAIYYAKNNTFTVFVLPLITYANTLMLSDSQTDQWNLNWFGILN